MITLNKKHCLQAVFVAATIQFFPTTFAFANVQSSNSLLSVDETVGSVFIRKHHGLSWHWYRAANPDARDALYRILNDVQLKQYQPNAWRILGYVGDAGTVSLLESNLLHSFAGELNESQQETITVMFQSLGLMAGRNITEAGMLVQRLAVPAYWKDSPFKWPGKFGTEIETVLWLNDGYALSGKRDLDSNISRLVAAQSDPKIIEYFSWRTSASRLESLRESIVRLSSKSVLPSERVLLRESFNGDLNNPRPKQILADRNYVSEVKKGVRSKTAVVNIFGSDEAKKFQGEALFAFSNTVVRLLSNDYGGLATTIADNGRPLLPLDKQTPEAVTAKANKLKAMSRDLEITKTLVQEIQSKGFKYGEAQGEESSDGSIHIRIPCLDSQETGKRHIPQQASERTTDSEGRLVIYMIKKDGQWYWNPFGW